MEFQRLSLEEVLLVKPDVWRDERGFFLETYHLEKYRDGGLAETFVQDNHSFSVGSILRGLHAQVRYPQGKLVRAILGEIFDVAVDIRRGSPSFGRWYGVRLSADNFLQLWIPPDFAHGFCVLSERAQVEYKCTTLYRPEADLSIAWDDPEIGIEWPIDVPLLSPKDARAPRLAELGDRLPVFRG